MLQKLMPITAATLSVIVFTGLACAAQSVDGDATKAATDTPARITSNVQVDQDTTLSADESHSVSLAGGRILRHVAQARSAIADAHKDDALAHIAQGLTLTQIIDNVIPHYNVKTEIASGDYVYEDEEDVTSQYVTLFEELDRVDVVTPIAIAKKEAAIAGDSTRTDGASTTETAVLPTTTILTREDVEHTVIRLDVPFATRALHRAKQELDDSELNKADATLLALQAGGVIFDFVEVDLPLEEAADNLKLAEHEMRAGRRDAATVLLNVAADGLSRYQAVAGEHRAEEVKVLRDEISTLAAAMGDQGDEAESETSAHGDTIAGFWQRVSGWLRGQS